MCNVFMININFKWLSTQYLYKKKYDDNNDNKNNDCNDNATVILIPAHNNQLFVDKHVLLYTLCE